jgi:hypothetical protein
MWILLIGAGWLALAGGVAVVIGKGIRRADDIEGTNRFDWLPIDDLFDLHGDLEAEKAA